MDKAAMLPESDIVSYDYTVMLYETNIGSYDLRGSYCCICTQVQREQELDVSWLTFYSSCFLLCSFEMFIIGF